MIKKTILLTLILSLTACANSIKKMTLEDLPQEHQWNKREMTMLESLSLHNYTPKQDHTNRVVNDVNAAKLGQALFFDKRFSANGKVSCASCHKPELFFTDGLPQATGLFKATRNSPSIVGASNQIWFFLDGRTDSLWSQALHPIENTLEHQSNRSQFAQLIYNDPILRNYYENIFGPMADLSNKTRFPSNAGPTRIRSVRNAWRKMEQSDQKIVTDIFVNGGKSIAAYETLLQPAPSRFDNYVKSLENRNKVAVQNTLSINEVKGLRIFLNKGKCFICHNGPMFSDQGFHNIGTPPSNVKRYDFGRSKAVRRVKKNPFNCLSEYNDSVDKSCEELKYMVSHDEDTLASFKTPTLRNVSKTGPYMHAGQYTSLSDVIKHYNKPPATKVGMNKLLDIDLNEQEMQQLAAFLKSLDSEIDADKNLLMAPN